MADGLRIITKRSSFSEAPLANLRKCFHGFFTHDALPATTEKLLLNVCSTWKLLTSECSSGNSTESFPSLFTSFKDSFKYYLLHHYVIVLLLSINVPSLQTANPAPTPQASA